VDVSVYLPLYLGFALAVVTPRVVPLLPPRTGVWCLSAAAVTAAASWLVSLALISFTGLGRIRFVADEGDWSASLWRRLDPIGVWTARIAGAVLCVCVAMFVAVLLRELRSRRVVNRLTSGLESTGLMVFVDDETPHAYAVGGRRPRVVISRGLLRTMAPAERRAVFEHETAHVRHHHGTHLMVLRLCAGINPLLRPFRPVGELAVERWADEETAAQIGDRSLVARTVLRAALAGVTHADRPAGALAHSGGDVSRRVRALMQAPPPPRRSMTMATTALLVATISASVLSASSVNRMISAASLRPASTSGCLVGRPGCP